MIGKIKIPIEEMIQDILGKVIKSARKKRLKDIERIHGIFGDKARTEGMASLDRANQDIDDNFMENFERLRKSEKIDL